MLIVDLDDTIFRTDSIHPNIFNGATSIIKHHFESHESGSVVDKIISELWTQPIDVVFSKYNVHSTIADQVYSQIENIHYRELKIKTFKDYPFLLKLPVQKMLVTTGLEGFQKAKIKALGIAADFQSVYIDDPRRDPRRHKIDIFRQIVTKAKKSPKEVWVIGDNPGSEIQAGKALGMNTVQRLSPSKHISKHADFHIETFEELEKIVTKTNEGIGHT